MVKGRGRTGLRAAAVALAAATVVGVVAPVALAADAPAREALTVTAAVPTDRAALDRALRDVVGVGGSSAALARVVQDGRTVWQGAAGQADLDTGAPARADGRFRIGSTTKTFVATVVLQLVAERKVRLDDPIERYLPGTVPNGANITVRQLLNHTSGLYSYTSAPEFGLTTPEAIREWATSGRDRTYRPQELLAIAFRHQPDFAPGTDWSYSNTNYVVAGQLIEKVTGRSWAREVERRIIQPLGLHDTSMPITSTAVPGPHAKGYLKFDDTRIDVTRLNPSMAGSAGAGISTTADLTRFNAALLGGRLLRPAELAQMRTPAPQALKYGVGYGLALWRTELPCGEFWGHDGGIPGYSTMLMGDLAGRRQISYSINPLTVTADSDRTVLALTAALACGTAAPTPPAPAAAAPTPAAPAAQPFKLG
ncbi:serine hydrolase domain-containing protein [Kitasatospora sp. NPDC002040]|uniref:serine hydrolase domain-containing protein n=1 Tax=Kitasatospora sp. NPDC002040 TaxID=3154661 RepID=UPI00332B4B4C